jgi:hypothetical protein
MSDRYETGGERLAQSPKRLVAMKPRERLSRTREGLNQDFRFVPKTLHLRVYEYAPSSFIGDAIQAPRSASVLTQSAGQHVDPRDYATQVRNSRRMPRELAFLALAF